MSDIALVVGNIYKAETKRIMDNVGIEYRMFNNIDELTEVISTLSSYSILGIILMYNNNIDENTYRDMEALDSTLFYATNKPRLIIYSISKETSSRIENSFKRLHDYLAVINPAPMSEEMLREMVIGSLFTSEQVYNLKPKSVDKFKARVGAKNNNKLDVVDTLTYIETLHKVVNVVPVKDENTLSNQVKSILDTSNIESTLNIDDEKRMIKTIIQDLENEGVPQSIIDMFKTAGILRDTNNMIEIVKSLTRELKEKVPEVEAIDVSSLEKDVERILRVIKDKEKIMDETYSKYSFTIDMLLTEINNNKKIVLDSLKTTTNLITNNTSDNVDVNCLTQVLTLVSKASKKVSINSTDLTDVVNNTLIFADNNIKEIYKQSKTIQAHYQVVVEKQKGVIDTLKSTKDIILNVSSPLAQKLKIVAGSDGCGKTTTAIAIAYNAQANNKSVLILDYDYATPELMNYNESIPTNSIQDFLDGYNLVANNLITGVSFKAMFMRLTRASGISERDYLALMLKRLKESQQSYDVIVVILKQQLEDFEKQILNLGGVAYIVCNTNITNLKKISLAINTIKMIPDIVSTKAVITCVSSEFDTDKFLTKILGNPLNCIKIPPQQIDVYKLLGKTILAEKTIALSHYKDVK